MRDGGGTIGIMAALSPSTVDNRARGVPASPPPPLPASARDAASLRRRIDALRRTNAALRAEVAEHKRTEDRVRQSDTWLRLVVAQVPAALWTTDTKLRFTSSAGAALATIGVRPGALVGAGLLDYFGTRDPKFPPIAAHRAALRGTSGAYEIAWAGRTFQCRVEPLRDARSRIIGALGFALDVTERERAERDIRELNRALRQQIAARTTQLEEKEVLLKELHHRVKNNLQMITSLLSLHAAHVHDRQAFGLLKESENRVRLIAAIHAALHRSESLSRVDGAALVRDVAHSLLRSYARQPERIAVRLTVDPVVLDTETAVPCGLILHELVSNALKHAFPDARRGVIRVRLQHGERGRLLLAVSDDGVGLPSRARWRRPRSLGWRLVDTLARQLAGKVDVRGNKGTTVTVSFPEHR